MLSYKLFESSDGDLTEEIIKESFASTLDMLDEYEINEVWFDKDDFSQFAHNCWDDTNVTGWDVEINHDFWGDEINMDQLNSQILLLKELQDDIKRFVGMYNHPSNKIFLRESGNASFSILIVNN